VSVERVACLAFDSPGSAFLRSGLDAGRLPTLARLLEGGRTVSLVDRQDIATSASWPTLIRGCDLPDHGLGSDRHFVPGDYRVEHVEAAWAGRPPFWRYLSDAGVPSAVLSPYSAPLLDDFEGVQVTGWGSHDPFEGKLGRYRSDPPELLGEIERLVGRRAIRYDPTPPRTPRQVRAYVSDMVRGCDQQARALGHMLSRVPDWRFAWASFGECHQAGHLLWHFADPAHPDYQSDVPADLRDGLMRVYEATDRAIGAVIDALPEGTAVLVVSPYDMAANHHLDEVLQPVLERGGWAVRASGGKASLKVRALATGRRAVRALVPLGLRPALGRLAGRDRLLAELDVGLVDWKATRVLKVPSDGSAALRLNLAGREPAGPVQSGAEAERTLRELEAFLLELRCADTGRPVVARVARFEELYEGAEPFSGAADLYVEWAPVTRPRAVRSDRVGEVPVPAARSNKSLHRAPGFAIACGEGIEPDEGARLPASAEARLADVGATVLALLGVPAPPEITGRPIGELVPQDAAAGA
jgi:predicted AlkP superfamily phosphohydrolase/phosphomutase